MNAKFIQNSAAACEVKKLPEGNSGNKLVNMKSKPDKLKLSLKFFFFIKT